MTRFTYAMFIIVLSASFFLFAKTPDPAVKNAQVRIPWEDFKQMIENITMPEDLKDPASLYSPVDYVITSAVITGRAVENKKAEFLVALTVQVFPSKMLKHSGYIPVFLGGKTGASGCILEKVTLAGITIPFLNSGEENMALLSSTGIQTLLLTYSAPITHQAGEYFICMRFPPSASSSLEFTVDAKKAEILVNTIKRKPISGIRGTRAFCAIEGTGNLNIAYTIGAQENIRQPELMMKPKVFAKTGMLISIKENRIVYRYQIGYQIWHKKLNTFSCTLPDTLPIEQVEGAGIKEWNSTQISGKPVLEVTTNFIPEQEYSLTITFSRKLTATSGAISVPCLSVSNVDRQTGYYAIQAHEAMEVSISDSSTGLAAVALQELPDWIQAQNGVLLKFKYTRPNNRLVLDVKRHREIPVLVAIADEAHFSALITRAGYILAKYTYHIRNNHKQYLELSMPKEWRLWSALIDGQAVMPATNPESSVTLIPLKKMTRADFQDAGFSLEVVFWKELKKMGFSGTLLFAMPLIDINTQKVYGDIWAPANYHYTKFKGGLTKVSNYENANYSYGSPISEEENAYPSRSRKQLNFPVNQQMDAIKQNAALTLPVEIDIPMQGTTLKFSKSLTTAKESAEISFHYCKELNVASAVYRFILTGAVLCCGFIMIWFTMKYRKEKKALLFLCAGFFAFVVLWIINEITSLHTSGLPQRFLFAGFCGALFYGAYQTKKSVPKSIGSMVIIFYLLFSGIHGAPAHAEETDNSENAVVSMPWDDFKEIIKQLKKDTLQDTAGLSLPAEYTTTYAEFDGERVQDQEYIFSAHVVISVLIPDKWLEIPLGKQPVLFPSVTINGKSAPLGRNSAGENILIIKGKGLYNLTYRFTVPVTRNAGNYGLTFPLPGQTSGIVRLALDNSSYQVTANDQTMVPKSANAKKAVYESGIADDMSISIKWQQEQSQIAVKNAMITGATDVLYSIGMGIVQMQANVALTIINKTISSFSFTIPQSVDVIDLTGPAVASWESADSAQVRTVKIYFKDNIKDQTSFALQAERSYADTVRELTLPAVTLNNTTTQEGYIGVRVVSTIELSSVGNSVNVVQKDKRELPGWFGGGDDILFAYQNLSGGYAITFRMLYHRNIPTLAALVKQSTIKSVVREDGKMITELCMTVKNRGEQFLHIAAWDNHNQVWSLFCNNKPAKPSFDTVRGELLILLEKSSEFTTETTVKMVYLSYQKAFRRIGRYHVQYPSVNMPVQNISGLLYIPEKLNTWGFDGNLYVKHPEKKKVYDFSFFPGLSEVKRDSKPGPADFYENQPSPPSMSEKQPPQPMMNEDQRTLQQHSRGLNEKSKAAVEELQKKAELNSEIPPKKGVFGIVSRQAKDKPVASADLFGKGGFASGIDAVLAGVGGLKGDGSGSVGRRGVTGIGYGAGYGSGFGGGDEIIVRGSFESGLLSIPVDISFEGSQQVFDCPLMKKNDKPELSFYYRKTVINTSGFVKFFTYLLILIAASFITRILWSGWSKKEVIYGIFLPIMLSLFIAWFCGFAVSLDLFIIIPFLFFLYRCVLGVVHGINKRSVEKRIRLEEILVEKTKTEGDKGELKNIE